MNNTCFKGVFTALVTPFYKGQVDYGSLEKLVEHQLENGVEGFVVNGTTAESPTLEEKEVYEIFKFIKNLTPNHFPLVLGTGSNSTKKSILMTQKAQEWGADGALVVVPYYNKPMQEGLYQHFKSVAESTSLPIILYNVPGRTITSLASETILKLSQLQNINGIKEATGEMKLINEIKTKVPDTFVLSSGDDGSFLEFMNQGGHGVISVISHLIPKEIVRFSKQIFEEPEAAQKHYSQYLELLKWLYVESNPIPVKMALHLMGLIQSPELRLPLTTLSEKNQKGLEQSMIKLGIL